MIENKSLGSKIFDVLNVVFLVTVTLICIMPVWYVLCVSLSSKEAVNAGKVAFWPVGFNLFSYQKILGEGEFLGSFLISIKRERKSSSPLKKSSCGFLYFVCYSTVVLFHGISL